MGGDYSRVAADLCRAMSAFALISSASPPGADSQGGGAAGPVFDPKSTFGSHLAATFTCCEPPSSVSIGQAEIRRCPLRHLTIFLRQAPLEIIKERRCKLVDGYKFPVAGQEAVEVGRISRER